MVPFMSIGSDESLVVELWWRGPVMPRKGRSLQTRRRSGDASVIFIREMSLGRNYRTYAGSSQIQCAYKVEIAL
jgi:hypothetical protein